MSDKLSEKDIILMQALIKISAIERILIQKGIVEAYDINNEMTEISKDIENYFKTHFGENKKALQ